MGLVIGGVLAVALLALIIFPGFRKKLKVLAGGFLNIFVEDMAKTPEGARAVYNQAIEEAQEDYNKAAQAYNRVSGEYSTIQQQLKDLDSKITSAEMRCEALVHAGKMDEAKIYSGKRSEYIAERMQKQAYADKLESMVTEAREIHAQCGKRLEDLKKESKITVEEIKLNESMNSLLADLDELRRDSATDKMLGSVRDGASDLRKEVVGGMSVHQNRASTKYAAAEKAAMDAASDDYLESIKAKYQNQNTLQTGGSARK